VRLSVNLEPDFWRGQAEGARLLAAPPQVPRQLVQCTQGLRHLRPRTVATVVRASPDWVSIVQCTYLITTHVLASTWERVLLVGRLGIR